MRKIILLLFVVLNCNAVSQLRVLSPNGGEQIEAGSEYDIKWRDISWLNYVKMELSTDAGKNWSKIDSNFQFYNYEWKVPEIVGDSNLIRITQLTNVEYEPIIKWSSTFGGNKDDVLNSVSPTFDGGYILCGSTNSFHDDTVEDTTNMDGLIIKIDSVGKEEWSMTYKNEYDDDFFDIIQAKDSSYYVCGVIDENSGRDIHIEHKKYWLLKVDKKGNKVWDIQYDFGQTGVAYSLLESSDGNIITVGKGKRIDRDDTFGIWIKKNGKDREFLWDLTYYDDCEKLAVDIIETKEKELIIVAESCSDSFKNKGKNDALIIKLDSNGTQKWVKTYGSEVNDKLNSIEPTSDGGYIAVGYTFVKSKYEEEYFRNYWILKLDEECNLQWEKKIGTESNEEAISVKQEKNGDYIVIGKSNGDYNYDFKSHGGYDLWMIRLDPNGYMKWNSYIGKRNDELPKKLLFTEDGDYVIGGTNSADSIDLTRGKGKSNFWVIKIEADSNLVKYDISDSVFSIINPKTNVHEYNNNFKFAIYPNITNNSASVTIELTDSSIITLELYNSQGTKLETLLSGFQAVGKKELFLDLNNYPQGRYFLKLSTASSSHTEMLEIQR